MGPAPFVIGVGNGARGDDAAGLEVVRRLEVAGRPGTARCAGDLTRLLELWEGRPDVLIVDMILAPGSPVGTVRRFDIGRTPLPRAAACSSHGLGLAQAVELARALGRLPPRIEVLGIVGACTAPGAALSGPVAAAVAALAEALGPGRLAGADPHA